MWAPYAQATDLYIYSYALSSLKLPAIFICRGQLENTRHLFLGPERAEDALAVASVIVDAEHADPGSALTFTELGYRLATAVTTGAHEYAMGLATYEGHDFHSIRAAVSRARAFRSIYSSALPEPTATIRSTIAAAQPCLPQDPPLVSIVMPTYNRRKELRANLEALTKQTYPHFEVIVVNDSGEDVSNIVKEFSFARYLCSPQNMGSVKCVNMGLREARGEFVGVIADDDANYPQQIATLVAALVSANVDVAHGNILLRLDTKHQDGSWATYGHRLDHDGDSDPWALFWNMTIHAQGYLIRKKAFEKIGFLNESVRCTSDMDLSIRIAQQFDVAHVNMVNGEMVYRDDKSNESSRMGEGLAIEIDRTLRSLAPSDSKLISDRIALSVENSAHMSRQAMIFQPWLRLDPPIPLR